MFKAMNRRESSHAVTCTSLREERFSLCFHSRDTILYRSGRLGPSVFHTCICWPSRYGGGTLDSLFASVDTVLSKFKASDFALPNSLCDCSFLGPSGKKIPIISGKVSMGRHRPVTRQHGPHPQRNPHSLPRHEWFTCALDCLVSYLHI